jgi:hypothetical protein
MLAKDIIKRTRVAIIKVILLSLKDLLMLKNLVFFAICKDVLL